MRAECATQLEHRVNDRQLGPGYADYDLLAREAAVFENGRVSLAEDFFDRRPTPEPLPKHIHEISVLGKQSRKGVHVVTVPQIDDPPDN